MKKWISLTLVLLTLLAMAPAAAGATGNEGGDPAPSNEPMTGPVRLAIDPSSAYGQGYIPKAYKNEGKWYVDIPLPLKWEGSGAFINGIFNVEKFKNIIVTVEPLGSDSPLVPVTEVHAVELQRTFSMPPTYFNEVRTSFDWMRLTDDCVNGNYSVDFKCSYELDGQFVEQVFTIEFSVTGKRSASTGGGSTPTSMPRLMVTGYTIAPEKVMAGGDMTLNLSITNESDKKEARNIKVTLDSAGVFLPSGGTNVAFVDVIKAGEKKDLTFTFTVPKSVQAGSAPVTVTINYEDKSAASATETAEISVPVYQPIRLKIDEPQAVYTGMVGESFTVELKLYNLGQSPLYNVMAEISGENINPEGSYFGGTLEAGATKTVELSAVALDPGLGDMGDMGDMVEPYFEGEEPVVEGIPADNAVGAVAFSGFRILPLMAVTKPYYGGYYGDGMIGGTVLYDVTITLTYEDVTGESFTEVRTCQVEMMQMSYEEPYPVDPGYEEGPIEEPKNLTWLWVMLGCVGVLGGAALVVALSLRAKKRKKEIDNALL